MTKRRTNQLIRAYRNLPLLTLREYLAQALILVHSGQPCMKDHVDTLRGLIAERA